MSAKRYYWLKLKNTYFSQLDQKKMRKQKNGKDMQIIYLRMMLLRKNWQRNFRKILSLCSGQLSICRRTICLKLMIQIVSFHKL